MTIHHVSVFTENVDTLARFYKAYFAAREVERYKNEKTGTQIVFLAFEGGAQLEICSRPGFQLKPPDHSRGYAHISMLVDSPRAVDELTSRIAAGGHTVVGQPRLTGFGFYESTVMDPEGNWVEITSGKGG